MNKTTTNLIEMRQARRYPIRQALTFAAVRRGVPGRAHSGVSLDMSSCGMRFLADADVRTGQALALVIEWPARLNEQVALALHVDARVVRHDGETVAVRFGRWQFHTAPPRRNSASAA